jgi:uncharacterized protein (DUF3084 family)
MADIVSSQPKLESPAEYEAAIEECLQEIRRLNEQMRTDQAAIDRLKAETQQLKAETRAILASIKAMV